MHPLTIFLENEAGANVPVVEVNSASEERDGCICVNLSHLRALEASREFQEGAKKRMGVKPTNAIKIPYACLACPGYFVNHDSLKSFKYEDLGKAWEFLQSISIASTEATRSMVKRIRRGRTLEGYRLHMGMMETRYISNMPDDVCREVRNLGQVTMHRGEIEEAVSHSTMRVLNIGNCLALRSSLRLGLPPPVPLHPVEHAQTDETETLYSVAPSSVYLAPP
jgi:hypothetical protein